VVYFAIQPQSAASLKLQLPIIHAEVEIREVSVEAVHRGIVITAAHEVPREVSAGMDRGYPDSGMTNITNPCFVALN
jgi:hypothetical protein